MVGVDIVDIERLRAMLDDTPGLERRLFTEAERFYCRARRDPVTHLAGTLAAKEAVIKVLRLGPLTAWARRIEIVRDDSGVPSAHVRRGPAPVSEIVTVSISHDGGVAVAVALKVPPT
jgi:holo-[acyl-carrier protein] synthase